MYTPDYARMDDFREQAEYIKRNSFAVLITQSGGRIKAVHIPLLLEKHRNEYCLSGHVARSNDVTEDVSGEALAIFSGPHSYISPSWFETKDAVPTWNYIAVHVHGRFELIFGKDETLSILERQVAFYESAGSSYRLEDVSKKYLNSLLEDITAFRIMITRIEGKKKLSQNKTEKRQRLIIESLEKSGDSGMRDVADLMKLNPKLHRGE